MDLSNDAALVIPLSLPRARPEPGSTTASEPAPADLVTAARRGDRSAFAELYRQHVRMVHGLLLARVPRVDVDDLVQEVFLTVTRRLDSLRDPAAFPGWLTAIARNHAIDHLRRNGATPAELPENLAAHRSGLSSRRARSSFIPRCVAADDREAVFDALERFAPPPPGVTRDGIRRGDHTMRDAWWNALDLGDIAWWRIWQRHWP